MNPIIERFNQYVDDVISEKIPACKKIKQAVQRHLDDLSTAEERKIRFDEDSAIRAIEWPEKLLCHYKGEWHGKPFVFSPWQVFIRANLFGWMKWNEEENAWIRKYRKAYIQVPRKNGKTTDAATLALYMLAGVGEYGGEIYAGATKFSQAKIVHTDAKEMARASKLLREHLSLLTNNICCEKLLSKFEPIAADSSRLDGLNVFVGIIDELHEHQDGTLCTKLETGTGSRREPLIYKITTPGDNVHSYCYEEYDWCEKILSGVIQDDSYFSFIAELDEHDDWKDEAVWYKANPNLGISKKITTMREECERAKKLPTRENDFRRYHTGEWVQQKDRWIPMDLWDKMAGDPIVEVDFHGQRCHAALDLSTVSDFTAWTMLFPDVNDDELVHVISRAWCPEAMLYNEHNKYRNQYQAWAKNGFLKVTDGDVVDYDFVYKEIIKDCETFDVIDIRIDTLFQGQQLATKIQERVEGRIEVCSMGMGFLSFASPMMDFERRMLLKKIHHGGNPILKFCANNVVIKKDPAGNMKPDKASSHGKIDGIVTIIMALDGVSRYQVSGCTCLVI